MINATHVVDMLTKGTLVSRSTVVDLAVECQRLQALEAALIGKAPADLAERLVDMIYEEVGSTERADLIVKVEMMLAAPWSNPDGTCKRWCGDGECTKECVDPRK